MCAAACLLWLQGLLCYSLCAGHHINAHITMIDAGRCAAARCMSSNASPPPACRRVASWAPAMLSALLCASSGGVWAVHSLRVGLQVHLQPWAAPASSAPRPTRASPGSLAAGGCLHQQARMGNGENNAPPRLQLQVLGQAILQELCQRLAAHLKLVPRLQPAGGSARRQRRGGKLPRQGLQLAVHAAQPFQPAPAGAPAGL